MRLMFAGSSYAEQRNAALAAKSQKDAAAKAAEELQKSQQTATARASALQAVKATLAYPVLAEVEGCPPMTRLMLLQELQGQPVHYQRGLVHAEGLQTPGFYFTEEFLKKQGFSDKDISAMRSHLEELASHGVLERVTGMCQRRFGSDNPNALRGFLLTDAGRELLAQA